MKVPLILNAKVRLLGFWLRRFNRKEVGLKSSAGLAGADDGHQILVLEAEVRAWVRLQLVVPEHTDHRDPGFFSDLGLTDGAVQQAVTGGDGYPFKIELLLG